MDSHMLSLIDTFRTTKQIWPSEQEKPEEPRPGGRSAPPSPAELSLRAFMNASYAVEGAAPQTMAGWLAKWRQIVEHETEFDAGDASFNFKMMQQMVAEFEAIAEAPRRPFELASAIC
jgi:hypothetical protein